MSELTIRDLLKQADAFDDIYPRLLQREGGSEKITRDTGGVTKGGIAETSGMSADQIRALTPDGIKNVWRKRWEGSGGKLNNPGTGELFFDMHGNMNPATATRYLQRNVNALLPAGHERLKEDGIPGSGTMAAANEVSQPALAKSLYSTFRQHHADVARDRPTTHGRYLKGWNNRTAALSKSPALAPLLADPVLVKPKAAPVLVKGTLQPQPVLVKGTLQPQADPVVTKPMQTMPQVPLLGKQAAFDYTTDYWRATQQPHGVTPSKTGVMSLNEWCARIGNVASGPARVIPFNPVTRKLEDPMRKQATALSREELLARGECCGNGCKNCPYPVKKVASIRSNVEKAMTAAGLPRDVRFFVGANEKATAFLGDWHDEEVCDAANKLGRKLFNKYEEPDDTEIGYPEWHKATYNSRTKDGEEIHHCATNTCPTCGRTDRSSECRGDHEPKTRTRKVCGHCRNGASPHQQAGDSLGKAASIASLLRKARNATHEHPTEAQRACGNYAKGTFSFKGLTIKIENPKDSIRRGKDKNGKAWTSRLPADYGYFTKSEAIDGDNVDVFIGPDLESDLVVVIDQVIDGKYDESKFIVAVTSQEQAEKLYLSAYQKGWKLGDVSTTTVQQLKEWLKDGDHKKPFKGQMVKAAVVKQDNETGKWILWTRDKKRKLGAHDTPEEAYAQEWAIQKSQEARVKAAAWWKKNTAPDPTSLKLLPGNIKDLLRVTFGAAWAAPKPGKNVAKRRSNDYTPRQ